MQIDKILNQNLPIGRRKGGDHISCYFVPSGSNIKKAIAACVEEAMDYYFENIDLSKQDTTCSKYYEFNYKDDRCVTYKDVINDLLNNVQTKKKMTVKDIEDKLGYEIEIIS
jgi:hypothetical protein